MKAKLHLLFYLIFLANFLLAQQEFNMLWNKTYPLEENTSEQIHDAYWMRDGNVILVGEVTQKKTKKDGLLLIINPENGELIQRKVFSGFGNDVLKAIVYADYSLYAVGYTDKGLQKKRNGWLLELDWSEMN